VFHVGFWYSGRKEVDGFVLAIIAQLKGTKVHGYASLSAQNKMGFKRIAR
jgi:hypothetical protein